MSKKKQILTDGNIRITSNPYCYTFFDQVAYAGLPALSVNQSFYPSAPYIDSFVLSDGGIAPNHCFTTSNGGGLTAAYVSDCEPWDLLSPDFSSRHAPHVAMDYSFDTISDGYSGTSSPYACNSHTTYSSGDMERVAAISQPPLANGTNVTALSANTGRQRVMKSRSTCKTCRKSFSRPSDLNRHAKKHQPGTRIYTCSVAKCDYEGSYRKDKLAAHVRNCHT